MGTVPLAEGAYSYSVSKAAVHHLTKILAGELASHNITVNAFAPGPFPSKMTAFAIGSEEGQTKVGANVPIGRVGSPEDIAGATLFLCGRGGAYTSGAIIPLDGGMNVQGPSNLFATALT
jgi:NAD(P)-dependent dehydrogenase (short-subunit alcohol dehydrogenase family)